jgi:hypothetical protein
VYWRTLKRLYFMKSGKLMDVLMVKDCINVSYVIPSHENRLPDLAIVHE